MMFFANNKHNIKQFKNMHNNEVWKDAYRYIYYIRLENDEISDYFEHFKKCEQIGFSYFFYIMDTHEYLREMVGFTNFALEPIEKGTYIDLSRLGDNIINIYFNKIFQEEGYFVVSDNTFKKGSQEEIEYEKVINKVKHNKTEVKLLNLH